MVEVRWVRRIDPQPVLNGLQGRSPSPAFGFYSLAHCHHKPIISSKTFSIQIGSGIRGNTYMSLRVSTRVVFLKDILLFGLSPAWPIS